MEDARKIARRFKEAETAPPHGTVVLAGCQTAGRGRLPGRSWVSGAGESLLCTVILHGGLADTLSLRAGLAASETFDSFLVPAGKGGTQVKWPNDVLYKGKKLSGILCEADAELSFIGAGLNVRQKGFPPEIEEKASSLALILGDKGAGGALELSAVLERFLFFLKQALSQDFPWREKLAQRLFMLNQEVHFAPGSEAASDGALLRGILRGIGEDGALLLETEGKLKALYSGELLVFKE